MNTADGIVVAQEGNAVRGFRGDLIPAWHLEVERTVIDPCSLCFLPLPLSGVFPHKWQTPWPRTPRKFTIQVSDYSTSGFRSGWIQVFE